MSKVTKKDLLERIEILEQKEKQRGIGNNFMTLKCIQGNRTFTKDVTYAASKTFDSIVITNNFGSVRILEENTNMFGGYKVAHDTQTAVFQVIGADVETEPKPKVLDQSVFDGLDAKWRFAAVDSDGSARAYNYNQVPIGGNHEPHPDQSEKGFEAYEFISTGYDTSNWQNSLIERDDIAKELLEIDLSSELTGSDLCRKMLERGDKYVMCMVDDGADVICDLACFVSSTHPYIGRLNNYRQVTPINNQGEPLTAADAGL